MSAVLIDTDVLLDVFIKRAGHFEDSLKIFQLVEAQKIQGFITAVSVSNLYYILKKSMTHEKSVSLIDRLTHIFEITTIDKPSIKRAIFSKFNDFEDALQNFSSLNHSEITAIITRNVKDYRHSQQAIFTPVDFLAYYNTMPEEGCES